MARPLHSVVVVGEGARVVREGGGIVYRKWVRAPKGLEPGELVVVEDSRGNVLGCALYDTVGPVALRVVWHGDCKFESPEDVVREVLIRAYRYRRMLGFDIGRRQGFRLVHSDGDLAPGLIIDVYDDMSVIQSSSIVWDVYLGLITRILVKDLGVNHVYEKSTQRTRRDIGLEPRQRLLYGTQYAKIIEEGSARFYVDARRGQKTGFFLDQRENRLQLENLVEKGDTVLDLFSYTGGFGIHALLAGANRAVFVDEDPDALEMLKKNLELNGIDVRRVQIVNENVWSFLGRDRAEYDIVIVDPPAFIQSREQYEKGLQAYRRLYRASGQRAKRLIFYSSCSTFLKREDFLSMLGYALALREYRLLGGIRGQPADHPIRPNASHLEYLKAAFVLLEK